MRANSSSNRPVFKVYIFTNGTIIKILKPGFATDPFVEITKRLVR